MLYAEGGLIAVRHPLFQKISVWAVFILSFSITRIEASSQQDPFAELEEIPISSLAQGMSELRDAVRDTVKRLSNIHSYGTNKHLWSTTELKYSRDANSHIIEIYIRGIQFEEWDKPRFHKKVDYLCNKTVKELKRFLDSPKTDWPLAAYFIQETTLGNSKDDHIDLEQIQHKTYINVEMHNSVFAFGELQPMVEHTGLSYPNLRASCRNRYSNEEYELEVTEQGYLLEKKVFFASYVNF